MFVLRSKKSGRVLIAITTSSSEALPARSPMPLMHVSIWRAPALYRRQAVRDGEAEVVVAVHGDARLVDVRHVLLDVADELRELLRDRVADGVRDVHRRRAGVDALRSACGRRTRGRSASRPSARTRRRCSTSPRARPSSRAISSTRSLSFSSWCMMWMSELERKTWMRGCSACCTASQQASTSPWTARARPAIAEPRTCFAICRDGLEVAGRRRREPGLDDVDAQALERAGDLQLLLDVQRDAGRLLAVAQRRIEDQYLVFSCHSFSTSCRSRWGASTRAVGGRAVARTVPASALLPTGTEEGRLRLRLSLIARMLSV